MCRCWDDSGQRQHRPHGENALAPAGLGPVLQAGISGQQILGLLTSVAIATAYRPYWARSTSATFKTFGSTIGSDAGINLFHEFGPDIRQMVKGHAPKFVSKIGERITNYQTPREVVSTPAR
jgi:hypothetical protein